MILSDALANRRWARLNAPFEHIRAENVFAPHYYSQLEAEFNSILDNGFSEKRQALHFSRSIPNFDAYVARIPTGQSNPLRIFISREWHDVLTELLGVNGLGYVNAELHHHPVRSSSGFIHTDLNPGWFVRRSNDEDLTVSDNSMCNYRTGKTDQREVPVIKTIRAVAMIFYLGNKNWKEGHGGETGLYESKQATVEIPNVFVPPHNNSLLAFRCTPHSYHAFVSNKKHPRNCIVLWVHASYDEAASEWGEQAIAQWPTRGASSR